MRYEEAQELARGDAKHTFLRVESQVYCVEAREGLLQVLYQGLGLPRFYHNVINVGFDILSELQAQGDVHQPLKGSSCVTQSKRHACIAVYPAWCQEGGLFNVFYRHLDLVISGEGVQEA